MIPIDAGNCFAERVSLVIFPDGCWGGTSVVDVVGDEKAE